MKLKFFTDKKYVPGGKGWVTLLEPFWGRIAEDSGFVDKDRFLKYCESGKDFFEQAKTVDEADFLLFPAAFELLDNEEGVREMASLAKSRGKRLVLFFNSDSTESIDIDNVILFRTSFYKSSQKENEYSLPGWSQDYIENYFEGKLQLREKSRQPVIGYCGYIDYSRPEFTFSGIKNYIKRKILKRSSADALIARKLRGSVVRELQSVNGVVNNFIIRTEFMGSKASAITRKEFIDNIIASDYCIVTRGEGNFSYRLYEVMSCGRIPLFINTDSVLPYDHIINWKDYFVWIEESELPYIGEKLLDFHASISNEEFVKRQKTIRELYEEWISPVGFHKNLWRCIANEIGE